EVIMDTVITTVFGGMLVTLLAYAFHKWGVSGHAQRAIVFVLCLLGALAQLTIGHKLGVTSDPATWFTAVISIQGAAQILYGLVAAGLKWGSGGATNPT